MSSYKFKSSGRKFNIQRDNADVEAEIADALRPIGILTPLKLSQDDRSSLFEQSFDLVDQIRDNFRNMLLTSPGERLGRFDFGTGLRNLTFEMIAQNDDYESIIMEQIKESVDKFMPYINLKTMTSDHFITDTQTSDRPLAKIIVVVEYGIPSLSVIDQKIDLVLYAAG
jgi:phage baseplate assembly protein W